MKKIDFNQKDLTNLDYLLLKKYKYKFKLILKLNNFFLHYNL